MPLPTHILILLCVIMIIGWFCVIMYLHSVKKTKCVIVLTHSPSLMAAADALHLLDAGTIVESGTFATLKNLDSFKYVLQSASQSAAC